MAKNAVAKPLPVVKAPAMTTNAPAPPKMAKTSPGKKNAMAALFGQKRQKPAVANVPTKTPAF